jgi:hypothetical protein
MHKVYLNLILILSIFCLSNCQNREIVEKIEGVWIFDYRINNLYLDDTTNFLKQQSPTIVDFKRNGDVLIKNFGYRDTTMNWTLNSDTLIQLGDLEYRLHSITSDSLSIMDYNPVDTFWIIYKRPQPTTIALTESEIKKILVQNHWTSTKEDRKWDKNVQYFDNNTQLFRYRVEDLHLGDSTDNLQIENFGVGKYQNYYFLYNFMDWENGNGNFESINQLLNIEPTQFSVIEFGTGIPNEVTYNSKSFDSSLYDEAKSNLIGRWHSINSDQKSYGNFLPRGAIESGRVELFNGILTFDLRADGTGEILLNDEDYATIRWILTKDRKGLIFEHDINEPDEQGIYVEPMNILEMGEQTMKVRLQQPTYYLGGNKPNSYRMNIKQDFVKQE